jgi:pimeloyl-ACP methyl ester carboxylesterase
VLAPSLRFGTFRLDRAQGRLWRASEVVPLTPKAFAVLDYLVGEAGRLVTKSELLDVCWPGVHVGDAALKVCIREIRRALDDDAHTPKFVETAHRRGYRFIAPVASEQIEAAIVHLAATSPRAETHYARSGDVTIAYQTVGDGPLDLVFVMGWISHLDYFWEEPSFARFLGRLASFSRLILFDKRGTGLSDRGGPLPTLEQRMDDVRAVMDAVGSREAALLGVSEGGPMCALFAATYPERTRALVMIGSYARRMRAPDYPWAPSDEERQAFYDEIQNHWGGPVGLETRAPSMMGDPEFRAWWSTYLRMGASPGTALALTRMNTEVDVRDVLPSVRVPTLVLHRRGDRCLLIEEGRYVASLIPGARFVELPGNDHLPFVGDQQPLLDEIESFLKGSPDAPGAGDGVLMTLVCSVYGPAAGRTVHEEDWRHHARHEVEGLRGRAFDSAPGELWAGFDGPARALKCAKLLASSASRFGFDARIGVHTGECEIGHAAVTGSTANQTADIARRAVPGEVLVSRTVRDLVSGSPFAFADRNPRAKDDTGLPLFSV